MSNINSRIQRLEQQHTQGRTIPELERRVNQVLQNPHLVTPAAFARITELLDIAKQRQATP